MKPLAAVAVAWSLMLVGCSSGRTGAGRIPYDPTNKEQFLSPQQMASLTDCGGARPVTRSHAFQAATCSFGSAQVTIAVFNPLSDLGLYLAEIRQADPKVKVEVGPYWVASSDRASSSRLNRFQPAHRSS